MTPWKLKKGRIIRRNPQSFHFHEPLNGSGKALFDPFYARLSLTLTSE